VKKYSSIRIQDIYKFVLFEDIIVFPDNSIVLYETIFPRFCIFQIDYNIINKQIFSRNAGRLAWTWHTVEDIWFGKIEGKGCQITTDATCLPNYLFFFHGKSL
jgi:hypothetical protein